MAKKQKGAVKAKGNGKAQDIAAEVAEALGDNAPKKEKGQAYLKALVYAVSDEEKMSGEQYDALSSEAKAWLSKAAAVMEKDKKADVPEPGAAVEATEDDADETEADETEGDETEDETEAEAAGDDDADADETEQEEKVAKPKKSKAAKGAAKGKAAKAPAAAKGKAAKAPATKAPAATKSKAAKKPATPAVANKSAAEIKAAVDFAKKFSEEGPCVQVRKVTEKYKGFARADVLAVADALKINRFTASRQYQVARAAAK